MEGEMRVRRTRKKARIRMARMAREAATGLTTP